MQVRQNTPQELEVLKIDIDIPWDIFKRLKYTWVATRRAILSTLGYELADWIIHRSQNGKVHAWITVEVRKPLSVWEKAELQFLLGDDHNRSKLNFLRAEKTPEKFDSFNILFSKKVVKNGENGEGLP